jgi:hypothetical protein
MVREKACLWLFDARPALHFVYNPEKHITSCEYG